MPNIQTQADSCAVRITEQEPPVIQDISVYVPEKNRKPGELVFTGLIIIFGVLGYYFATELSSDSYSAPSVFPKIASLVIFCGGLLVLLSTAKRERPQDGETAWQYLMPRPVQVMLALLGVYCFALPFLRFLVSSFIFLVVGMTFLNRGKHLFRSCFYSAVILACLTLVFRYVMLVILP